MSKKVLCVNDKFVNPNGSPHPKIGDIDAVTARKYDDNPTFPGWYIRLDRFTKWCYAEEHFVYLDDEEVNTLEEKVKELVTI